MLISLMLPISALAMTANQISADNHYVVGLSAGPTWIAGNKTQTINLEPDVIKTYTGHNKDNTFATGEFFLGWQKAVCPFSQSFVGQLGVSVVAAGNAELNGSIWEDADPAFDNYSYLYKVNHTHVALKGRLVGAYDTIVEPYVSASVGVGYNHAYDFQINPYITEEVPAPAFKSNATTTFTYTLGIGIQKALSSSWQAAIGYEFSDWGQVKLSPATGQVTNQSLTLSHLYGNELQISLFYTV